MESLPHKKTFLTIDFYIQCFFAGITILLNLSSIFAFYFALIGLYVLILATFYNSIGICYHIFKGSYSERVGKWRKYHAFSALVYLVVFVLVIIVSNQPANTNYFTLFLFWVMPYVFLASYFFITYQDYAAMKTSS